MLNDDVERAVFGASEWLRDYFFRPGSKPSSDAEIRLFLSWAVGCRNFGASRNLVPCEDVHTLAWRFGLTADRIREALLSTPNATAFRLLSDLAGGASGLATPFDAVVNAGDVQLVRGMLEEAVRDPKHVARREILLRLLDQEDYAEIAKRSDFWADFVTFDLELSRLLEIGLDAARAKGFSVLLDRLLFKYLSLRDADRLCPVLRATRYLSAELPESFQQGLAVLTAHCFEGTGVVAQAVALHLSEDNKNSPEDLELQVTVKTTISALFTLLEAGVSDRVGRHISEVVEGRADPRTNNSLPHAAVDRAGLSRSVRAAEERAIDWLERALPRFDPYSYARLDKFEFSVKTLAELVFVCARFVQADNSIAPAIERMHNAIFERILSKAGFKSFLLQNLSTLPAFSICASLRECGHEDPEFLSKLEACCRQSNVVGGEYAPALFMDLAHSVLRCGLPWQGPPLGTLFDRSLLASLPDWHCLKDPEYYAITHAIFFLTDFGKHPDRLPSGVRSHFATEYDNLLFFFASRGHWDLLGEILLCGIYLDLNAGALSSAFLQLLLSIQEADGSFVCDIGTTADKDDEDKGDPWREFLNRYHTTLVVLLITAALRTKDRAVKSALPQSQWGVPRSANS